MNTKSNKMASGNDGDNEDWSMSLSVISSAVQEARVDLAGLDLEIPKTSATENCVSPLASDFSNSWIENEEDPDSLPHKDQEKILGQLVSKNPSEVTCASTPNTQPHPVLPPAACLVPPAPIAFLGKDTVTANKELAWLVPYPSSQGVSKIHTERLKRNQSRIGMKYKPRKKKSSHAQDACQKEI
jgi:hypothetical protein